MQIKKLISLFAAVMALLCLTMSVAFMSPAERQDGILQFAQQDQQQNKKQKKNLKKNQQVQQKKQIQTMTPKQTTDFYSSLRDDAHVLNTADKQAILSLLKGIEKKHGIRCAVVFVTSTNGQKPGVYANGLIDRYYTDGAKGNIVLVVDTKARKYYFSDDNNMRKMILDGDSHGVGAVKEAIVPELKKNRWAGAAKAFANKVDELCTYYEKEGKPYDPANEFSVLAAAIAAIIAAIGAYGVRSYLIGTMSNVAPEKTAKEYLVDNSVNITERQDIFLYTSTAVTHREKSSRDDSTDSSHGGGGGSF